ncbi:nickel/cobalt efflux protein RcnA [Chromobacterium phragmitis]|uniref:Nickel/cobalt efflux system n=1 Tax=Chromobacterium phragmitis TaxID=2202141 RepID=A0A344UG29_9NEIS|nr:nickel/cobalt efflux transporter [Chromobacterium phragmitis]AXE28868.1 nickel/cobalt efflux protein RcnA [Chromobacterium phragmitis]AXE34227.1 nickel/cobalt efflux protein RcnA [Chromobacterium phragmitis]
MTSFATLLQQGNAWLFIPSAVVLGALHGLEPGHSKTMMAAFIVAVRGTVRQAVLLGLAATVSHTAVVWLVAMAGLYFGRSWNAETAEPYFQMASAALVILVAAWMMWRTWRHSRQGDDHGHGHHREGERRIDTGHGVVTLEIFETGAPPRFRLSAAGGHRLAWRAEQVGLETERAGGGRQAFAFRDAGGFLESVEEIPEPHEFIARLKLGHGHHSHDYDVEFAESDHHRAVAEREGVDVSAPGYQDPHEMAHANDIRRRFAGRDVTTGQIVLFGLTGGLVPCPASITVLLLCLQLKQVALGATLVLCFSIGLALTMVASGVLAALSVKHVSRRWSGFGDWVRKAPYISGALIMLVGLYLGWSGWAHLA